MHIINNICVLMSVKLLFIFPIALYSYKTSLTLSLNHFMAMAYYYKAYYFIERMSYRSLVNDLWDDKWCFIL